PCRQDTDRIRVDQRQSDKIASVIDQDALRWLLKADFTSTDVRYHDLRGCGSRCSDSPKREKGNSANPAIYLRNERHWSAPQIRDGSMRRMRLSRRTNWCQIAAATWIRMIAAMTFTRIIWRSRGQRPMLLPKAVIVRSPSRG